MIRARLYSRLHQYFLRKYHDSIGPISRYNVKPEKAKNVKVTTHALLRYYSRVVGVNTYQVKQEILADNLSERVAVLGDGVYPVGNLSVVVINNTVVTVYPNKGRTEWRKA